MLFKKGEKDDPTTVSKNLATFFADLFQELDDYERKIPFLFKEAHTTKLEPLNRFFS